MSHPIVLVVVADGLLSLMDALIKLLTARYPTFQIVWLRFSFGLIGAMVLLAFMRPGWPGRETVIFNATRSLLVVVVATTFFYALSVLPLAEAIALSFVSPLFMVLFGVLLLGERIDSRIGVALVAGLAGMLLIAGARIGDARYSSSSVWLGALAAVISAMAYGLVMVLLRARATRDPLPTIVFFQNLGPCLILALPAAFVWVPPSGQDLALFAAIGAIGVTGHYLLAQAFAKAEAARLAPITYVSLVWATLFGYLFFSEWPTASALAGAALIVIGTLVTQRNKT
jgi:drug/metabolite transporter (DMT)-like permease